MSNKLIALTFIALINSYLYSQTCSKWKWAEEIKKNYDINLGNQSEEIEIDSKGNLIISGSFSTDSIIFNNGVFLHDAASATANEYIVKYDSTGSTIWAINIPANHQVFITDIKADENDNIFINGYYRADTLFLGTDTLINNGIYNHFISKLNPNGNFIWSRSFGSISGWGSSKDLAINDNIVYASGNMYQNSAFNIDTISLPGTFYNKLYIARYDTSGNFIDIFTSETSSGHDRIRGMDVDKSGNIYIIGDYTMDFELNSVSFPLTQSGTDYKLFVVKLNNNFQVNYSFYSESSENDYGQSIIVDNNSNCYFGCFSKSNSFIFSGNTAINNKDFNQYIIGKINKQGNLDWLNNSGGTNSGSSSDKLMCFSLNDNNNLMAFMNFNTDTIFFGNDTINTQRDDDMWLLKIDSDNAKILEDFEIIEIGDQDIGGLASGNGNLIGICGYHRGIYDVAFGSDTLSYSITGGNSTVGFVALYNSFEAGIRSNNNYICNNDSIILYGTENLLSYQWLFNGNPILNANSNSIWISQTGDYQLIGEHYLGCIDTSRVTTLNLANPTYSTINENSCNSYISPSGKTFTASGIYLDTIVNSLGCDSIITIDLTINLTNYGTDVQSACGNYTWIDGNTYTMSNNTATFTIVGGSVSGCDSIVSLDLTILNNSNGTDIQTSCEAFTWIDGNTYTMSNNTASYTILGGSANGCDSIVSLDLTIINLDTSVTLNDPLITANSTGLTYQWVSCPLMTSINGATNQSYSPTSNGSYAVIVSNNGCSDTSACYSINNVNIIENEFEYELSIYPNPSYGNFTINLGNNYDSIKIYLTDLNGKLIKTNYYTNSQIIDFNINKPAGVFLLHVQTEDKKAIIKLIKE